MNNHTRAIYTYNCLKRKRIEANKKRENEAINFKCDMVRNYQKSEWKKGIHSKI